MIFQIGWRSRPIRKHHFDSLGAIINMFLGSISNLFEVKSCNCEKLSRFSSLPFCPFDDAISFVELSVDIFKLSVYYTHLKNIYGVLKLYTLYIYPEFGILVNPEYRNISSESYDSPGKCPEVFTISN